MTQNRFFLGLQLLALLYQHLWSSCYCPNVVRFSPSTVENTLRQKLSHVDLSRFELLSSGVILAALTLIGLFPSSISERIDGEIGSRYSVFDDVQGNSGRPSCCPIANETGISIDADKEANLTNPKGMDSYLSFSQDNLWIELWPSLPLPWVPYWF